MNRGIAKRPLFETATDMRAFTAMLALETRRGAIEVVAWCLMTTHFHLLVRSVDGHLSDAMQRLQSAYSRYFNRKYRRDGPLVRSRYYSKPVTSQAYLILLVRYIDQNPTVARMVTAPWEHRYGSASQYVNRRGPRWLARDTVESIVRRDEERELAGPPRPFSAAAYVETFGGRCTPQLLKLVEHRMESGRHSTDPLDDLIGAAPERVRAWMQRKARLADGCTIGEPTCTAETVEQEVHNATREAGRQSELSKDDEETLRAGLVRLHTGMSFCAIGLRCGMSESQARRRWKLHLKQTLDSPSYSAFASRVSSNALAATFGGGG